MKWFEPHAALGGLLGQPSSYGGLLNPQDLAAAQQRGRLALGASLLGASGPSPIRQSPTALFGNAMQAGITAQDQASAQAAQQALLRQQMETLKQKQAPRPQVVPQGAAVYGEGGVLYENKGAGGFATGKFNPGDYTPESFAKFLQSQDPADLVRYNAPQYGTVIDPSIGVAVTNKRTGTLGTVVGPDQYRQAAADIAGAEQGAKTTAAGTAERALEEPQRQARIEGNIGKADREVDKVRRALSDVGRFTTGLGGSVLSKIPGSPALDLERTVDSIKANLGFQELQQMREQSPTGGALGQVAVQEINFLQAAVESLDVRQSPSQMRANLQNVIKHYDNWKSVMQRAQQGGYPAEIVPNSQPAAGESPRVLDFSELPD